jgi:hypothetical protein
MTAPALDVPCFQRDGVSLAGASPTARGWIALMGVMFKR